MTSMKLGQKACSCGRGYWPAQAWQHEGHGERAVACVVVDAASNVVVDRKRDRHRKTEGRKEYLRDAQRRSRATKRVST